MSRSVKVGGELKKENTSIEVREYLNRSGSALAPGDVVVLDTTNSTDTELYCTTTTSADDAAVLGVVIEACVADNGSRVRVLREGPTALLKADGTTNIARGDKLSTFTSAGIAAKAASGSAGWFAYALEAYEANDSLGVIDAYICVGRADSASAGGNTLDQAYDQGGAGSGRTINATDGAVVISNTQDDNADVLQVTYNPATGGSGNALTVTNGANSTGHAIDLVNTGTGKDIDGSGSTWSVTKAGAIAAVSLNASGAVTGGTLSGTITNLSATGDATITPTATTGSGVVIDGSTVTTGNVLRVEADATNLNGGAIIAASLDGTNKFTVGEDGRITIAGTASADEITITAGDVQVTAGNIDVDNGKIEVDTTADLTNYFKRNQTTTNGPVVEIEATHTGDDYPCLLLDHNATGAINALQIQNDGTGYAASLEPQAAGSGGLKIASAGDATNRMILVDGTAGNGWIGTGSNGMVELTSDGAIVADGALLRLASSGQPAAANDGVCLEIVETGGAQATSYALRIASTNNEALHVDTGVSLFDEAATFAAGIVCQDNGAIGLGTASAESNLKSDGSKTVFQLTNGALLIGDDGSANNASFAQDTGLLTFNGSARRTKTRFFGIGDFTAHTGSPALTQVGAGSAFGWAFDAAADESITGTFKVPDNWVAGSDCTAKIYWAANAGAGDCIWDIITVPLAASEAVAGGGNTDSVTDTTDAQANDLSITDAVTIAASTEWAAGDLVVLRINRNADDGGDTLAADALLLGMELNYTVDRI